MSPDSSRPGGGLMAPGCLTLIFLAAFFFLLPFLFANLFVAALAKLGLPRDLALLAIFGIFAGSLVNIPVKVYEREEEVRVDRLALFGIGRFFPRFQAVRRQTVLAVNVGGCVVPCLIAGYELVRSLTHGPGLLSIVVVTTANVAVCYLLARPVAGVGITMPALVPPVVAALGALLLAPAFAPPVAFIAGVLGPLIGADLLHLDEITKISVGMASIGGAGTFDGIVLSGLIATILA